MRLEAVVVLVGLAGGLAACGDGRADPRPGAPAGPVRLTVRGAQLLGPDGAPLRLRGVNVQGVTEEDVAVIADTFRMNLIRLRISFTPENRADTESGFTDAYRAEIDAWVERIRARRIWMVLELRVNDAVAESPDLYDTTKLGPCDAPTRCADFGHFLRAWRYLAGRYRSTDHIAGYGLLAEPSARKAGVPEPTAALVRFQRALMDGISELDPVTPFFVGADENYASMQLADDAYHALLGPAYQGRVVYEVNFLTPKEWIQDGTWTVDGGRPAYPFPDPPDGYDSLLAAARPGDTLKETFNRNRQADGEYQKTLSRGFIGWYLQWPLAFRERHHVPLYVDQFGASSEALGQLAYEGDLVDFFEANDLHWTRWSYNAAGPEGQGRTLMPPNDAAIAFYAALAAGW